jgi:dihydroorotate dehydrogenase
MTALGKKMAAPAFARNRHEVIKNSRVNRYEPFGSRFAFMRCSGQFIVESRHGVQRAQRKLAAVRLAQPKKSLRSAATALMRPGVLYSVLRPALFRLDAETAHGLAIRALKLRKGRGAPALSPALAVRIAGIDFPNPVGMAAGFDKDGEVPDALLGLGFGSAEVGSITPLSQTGNPKPRLFRLAEDRAVINRMGFNNGGAEAAVRRLTARQERPGIVGINIGANKDSVDRIADYATMARLMAPLASYLAVNISSPNTPGLRALQDESALTGLLDAVIAARGEVCGQGGPPIFLKVAPDLEPADIDAIARIAIERKLGALIVSNTTISRPPLASPHATETGGLSGAPLRDLAQQRLRDFRKATGGALPLVGVGGIANAEDAWARIRAGASLVQLYSAMVYEGPGIARSICTGLLRLMKRDGFATITEAVGTG